MISHSIWTSLQARPEFELLEQQAGFTLASVQNHGFRFVVAVRSTSVTYPHTVNYYALAREMRRIGCTHALSAGVAGTLDSDAAVPSLMIPDQFIDLHRVVPVDAPADEDVLYKDFSRPYCQSLKSRALAFLTGRTDCSVSSAGCYVGVDGPRCETAAEARAYRLLGGDVVGMTAVREAIAYRYCGLCFATVALITRRTAGFESSATNPAMIAGLSNVVLDCGRHVATQMTPCECE